MTRGLVGKELDEALIKLVEEAEAPTDRHR
jgi:hypothetical protein